MKRRLVALLSLLMCASVEALEVAVKGLFEGGAMLEVDGRVSVYKEGDSRRGVTLVSVDGQSAVIEFGGQQHTLGLSRQISSQFQKARSAEVRLLEGAGGHYISQALINNRPVEVMVDTGATAVAMSLPQAKALGIDYRKGRLTRVSTAAGVVDSFEVMLASVSLGNVRLDNVVALVNVGSFPEIVLLGNSFLSRVDMYRENGVLVLKSRF